MPSLRAQRRVPFVRPTASAPSVHRSLDTQILSSVATKTVVKNFIMEYSENTKLRACSSIYLKRQRSWNRCGHPLCWQCARQRANASSADLRSRCASYPAVYAVTLSLENIPSQSLQDAWNALDAVRARLTAGRWLTGRVAAFRWFTELTHGEDGWHPHIHMIAVSNHDSTPEQDDELSTQIINRWILRARDLGHHADDAGQHVQRVTRTPGRAVSYACKGVMTSHGDSRTPGRILLDAALRGDAHSADLWAEIEAASAGRHWQGTGGAFRGQPSGD